MQNCDRLLEALEQPDARIVAGENPGRLQPCDEQLGELRQQPVDPLDQGLEDQVVAVTIDDQPGQSVGFAVHQAVGGGVDPKRRAIPDGGIEPRPPQIECRGLVASSQQPQGDLGSIAVEGVTDARPAAAFDQHDIAASGADVATSLRYTHGWPFLIRSSPLAEIVTSDMGSSSQLSVLSCQLSAVSCQRRPAGSGRLRS